MAKSFSAGLFALPFSLAASSDPLAPELTYRPLPTLPFSRVAYSGRGEVDVVVGVVAGEPRHGRRRVSNWKPSVASTCNATRAGRCATDCIEHR